MSKKTYVVSGQALVDVEVTVKANSKEEARQLAQEIGDIKSIDLDTEHLKGVWYIEGIHQPSITDIEHIQYLNTEEL